MAGNKFAVKLSKVKTEEVSFREPEEKIAKSFNDDFLSVGFASYFGSDIDTNTVTVHLILNYDYGDEESGDLLRLLNYKGSFDFVFDNLKNYIDLKSNELLLPDHVLEKLLDISISTARGIIIVKTAGSFINRFYLPVFDPKTLLKGMQQEDSEQIV
ncbi:MAG: hypothetical protein EAS52_02785 [Parapedobacter sp.]|nr:MAG: hypothetical protein EAS52_02785 [Parapedobacter sp.]